MTITHLLYNLPTHKQNTHIKNTMNKYTVFLREIRVVPVIIEAESPEEAERLVKEGDGEYQNEKAYHSDLAADDYFDNSFEEPTKIME